MLSGQKEYDIVALNAREASEHLASLDHCLNTIIANQH
jgi:hypothetical protein